MSRRVTRRQLLRAGVVSGLVGAGGAAGATAPDARTRTAIESPRNSTRSEHGSWPAFQFDAANTGFSPDGTGPDSEPTARWSATTHPVHSSPAIVDGTVFLGTDEGAVLALSTETGAEQWRFDASAAVRSSPAVADGYVYAGDDDGELYALDAATGETQWTLDLDGAIRAAPTIAGDTMYVCTDAGELVAIQRFIGNRLWSKTDPKPIRTAPAVGENTVYHGGDTGTVTAFNTKTTGKRWEFDTEGPITAAPVLAGDTLYVASTDENLYALDAKTGAERWQVRLGQPLSTSPVVVDDRVFVAGDDGEVVSLDAETGTQNWLYLMSSVAAPPTAVDGMLYVGGTAGVLFALDTDTGEARWTYSVRERITTSPSVANGQLVLGTDDGQVLDLWNPVTPTPTSTPVPVTETGTPTPTPEATATPTESPSPTPVQGGGPLLSGDLLEVLTGTGALVGAVILGVVMFVRRRRKDDADDSDGDKPTTFGTQSFADDRTTGRSGDTPDTGNNSSSKSDSSSPSPLESASRTASQRRTASGDATASTDDDDELTPDDLSIDRDPVDRSDIDDPLSFANSLVVKGNKARKAGRYDDALSGFEAGFVEYHAIRESLADDDEAAETLEGRLEKLATIIENVRQRKDALADVKDTLAAAEGYFENGLAAANEGDQMHAKLQFRQAVELYRDAIKETLSHDLVLDGVEVEGQSFESVEEIKRRRRMAEDGFAENA